jgi:hypothetical protein
LRKRSWTTTLTVTAIILHCKKKKFCVGEEEILSDTQVVAGGGVTCGSVFVGGGSKIEVGQLY